MLNKPPLNKRMSLMPTKLNAHRTPWTKADKKTLKDHSRARTPVKKVAREMQRTQGALRQMAGSLGIGLGHLR